MPSCCSLALFGCLALAAPESGEAVLLDRIVAVIDQEIITLRELEAKAAPFLRELPAELPATEREARSRATLAKVLEIEIGERIVARELAQNRERLQVGERDIDSAVQEVMKSNHLSLEQLKAHLFSQGITWREYQDKLREQIERARLIQGRIQGKVQVRDADVRRRCLERQRLGAKDETLCASHVLIRLSAKASAAQVQAAEQRAGALLQELRAGTDFARVAMQHSDDKAAPDGKLGCFGPGEMVEAFERAAYPLQVGEISAPVRTPLGLHIIRVDERRAAATASCDGAAALEPFRQEIYQEAMQTQMQLWVSELRKKAFVEVRL